MFRVVPSSGKGNDGNVRSLRKLTCRSVLALQLFYLFRTYAQQNLEGGHPVALIASKGGSQ